jgi:hypothetical protein
LIQESIHLAESLTSTFNDRLGIILGVDLEHRRVLSGKNQDYRINNIPVEYNDGSFSENSASGNFGFNYRFGWWGPSKTDLHQGLAYIHLTSRLSDETRGNYGGSVGVRLNF